MHTVNLAGAGPAGGGGDRDEEVRMASTQLGDDSALAHRCWSCQDGQTSERGSGRGGGVGHGHIMTYRTPPARPAVSDGVLAETLHQCCPLVRPQATHPPGLGDMHVRENGVGCCRSDAREGDE